MTDKPLYPAAILNPDATPGEWPFESAVTGPVDITAGPIDFIPVPRLRKRRNGWTPRTQCAFIEALSQCGCVARAARAVGMTSRSAYRLLEAEGAGSFAAAWDQAIARGIERLRWDALDRAINGAWVPVVRRGKVVRTELRRNDRLAIALLSGRDNSIAGRRERAVSRANYRRKLVAERKREAADRREREQRSAAHQAILDEVEERKRNPRASIARTRPRVLSL